VLTGAPQVISEEMGLKLETRRSTISARRSGS